MAGELEALGPWHFEPLTDLIAVETVKAGDFLSSYAHRHYGDAELRPKVLAGNVDTINDPGDVFPGQEIRIPRCPAATAAAARE